METPLSEALLAQLPETARVQAGEIEGLESALAALVTSARAAHPAIVFEPTELMERVADRLASVSPITSGLAAIDAAELALAIGCANAQPEALAAFDALYVSRVPAALARMRLDDATVDDVEQIVRERLLVAEPGRAPRLLDYAGDGQLGGLVRVVATRTALDLIRKQRPTAAADADPLVDVLAESGDDPELALIKDVERAAFKRAFQTAVAGLEPRERTLLRLHVLDGASIDEVGALYGVHRATAARWLSRIRDAVERATRRALLAELGVGRAELDSMLRLVQSQLDLSFCRVLDD